MLCYYDYDYGGGRNACIIENIESIHIHKRNKKVITSCNTNIHNPVTVYLVKDDTSYV